MQLIILLFGATDICPCTFLTNNYLVFAAHWTFGGITEVVLKLLN